MVPGGLLATSSTTRLTPGTSSSSQGARVQAAVMASSLDSGRSSSGCLSRLLRVVGGVGDVS
jgi:hypothetical protein